MPAQSVLRVQAAGGVRSGDDVTQLAALGKVLCVHRAHGGGGPGPVEHVLRGAVHGEDDRRPEDDVGGPPDVGQRREQGQPDGERLQSKEERAKLDGMWECILCFCCSTACPAQCISIQAGEYPEGDARRGYERFPQSFVIDELRCIFCGYCVEACPVDAIRMDTGKHAVPYDSREQFIYKKDLLSGMTDRHGDRLTENPRHEPGDPTHPGVDRMHGGH